MTKNPAILHRIYKKSSLHLLVILGGIIVLAIATFPLKTWVEAQLAGQSLEVSPPSQELTTDPGQTQTLRAKIRNTSNQELPIKVRVEDFTASGEEGQVAITAGSTYSVATWTKVIPSSFTLGPGEDQEVTATITVPENAAGGRYGSFVFAVEGSEEQGTASVSQQIASLFLMRITGTTTEEMKLTNLTAPKLSEFGPIPFTLMFENTGNVHVKTYGIINVTNIFGQKVEDIVVPATNVFPEAKRIIPATLNKKFLFGPHTATAIMYYGTTENKTLTATTNFFVFPTRIALIMLGIIIILYFMRNRLKKAIRAIFKG